MSDANLIDRTVKLVCDGYDIIGRVWVVTSGAIVVIGLDGFRDVCYRSDILRIEFI